MSPRIILLVSATTLESCLELNTKGDIELHVCVCVCVRRGGDCHKSAAHRETHTHTGRVFLAVWLPGVPVCAVI